MESLQDIKTTASVILTQRNGSEMIGFKDTLLKYGNNTNVTVSVIVPDLICSKFCLLCF